MTYIPPLPDYPPRSLVTETSNPARTTLNRTAAAREQRLAMIPGQGAVVPLGYGYDQLPAIVPKVGVYGGDLVMLLVWCLGEVESIDSVTLSDGSALSPFVTLTHYTGTTTQTVDSILAAAFPGWTNTLVATVRGESVGLAYTVAVVPMWVTQGVPEMVARIRQRKVYDPRDAGQDPDDASTWEYSDNPALAKADFEASALYGRGRAIDWDSVETVADACDELVSGEKRRLIGLTLEQKARADDWGATLNAYAKCFTVDDGDAIKLVADRPRSATRSIGDAHIIHDGTGRPRLRPRLRGRMDAPTVVHVIYTDTTTDQWQDGHAYAKASGVDTGTVEWRESVVRLPGIQRYSQARREAIERYNQQALADLVLEECILDDSGLQDQAGDVVEITSAIGLASKPFCLRSVQMVEPGRWRISGEEYQPGTYSDLVESAPTIGDTDLPNPAEPPAVTGLAVAEELYQLQNGNYASRIRATWDDPGFAFLDRYLIQVYDGPTLVFEGAASDEVYVTPAVRELVTYTVHVCVVSTVGAVGEADIEQIEAQGKYLTPGDVPSLSGFEVGGEVRLAWEPAVDIDIWRYEIRYGITDVTWANATLLDRVDALRFTTKDVPVGTWDFLVKALDSVGLYSDTEARRSVVVTLDNNAYLVDSYEYDTPTLTDMESFQLGRADTNTYYVTDDGDSIATNMSSSPLASNYPNEMSTYHDSTTSDWLSESWDIGTSVSGTWRATIDGASAISGSYTAYLELSTNGTDWTQYEALSAKVTARYARVRIQALTTSTLRTRVPGVMIRVDAVTRDEQGQDTSDASNPLTVTTTENYTAVKSITITPIGTSALSCAIDDIQASRSLFNQIAYSRDLTQSSVWTLTNASASYDQTGLEGVSNTASQLTDSDGSNYGLAIYTVSNFSADTNNVLRVWIKKDADTSRFPLLRIRYSGVSAKDADLMINTSTGAVNLGGSGAGDANYEVISYDANWWLFLLECEDVDTNTTMDIRIFPAVGNSWPTPAVAATGSIIVGNVDVYLETTLDEVRTMDPVFADAGSLVIGTTRTEFDVYLFNSGGTQVANDFMWTFRGV